MCFARGAFASLMASMPFSKPRPSARLTSFQQPKEVSKKSKSCDLVANAQGELGRREHKTAKTI